MNALLRSLWPVVRELRLLRLHWLMHELPAHDLRQAELILERQQLEETRARPDPALSLQAPQRCLCAHCPRPRLG